jgi:hypothetical protein
MEEVSQIRIDRLWDTSRLTIMSNFSAMSSSKARSHFGGVEVDHKIKLGRLHNRQVRQVEERSHQSGLSSLVGYENQLARRSAESRSPLYKMHVTGSPRDSNVYFVVSPFRVSA